MPALISALLAMMVYAVTLGGTYVYDDVQVVQNDSRLHHVDQWKRFWTTDYFDGGVDNLYRPLVSMSYAVEWSVHGDRPWFFHAVNILFHALAAAMVAEFARRALKGDPQAHVAALLAGCLFAVHPVHVEAVANIVGRAELACTAAIFTGLVFWCHSPLTIRRSLLIVFVGFIGLLCKEQGILQPLFWVLAGLLICRPRPKSAVQFFVLICSWSWAIYLIVREHILKFEWDRTYMDPTIQPLVRSVGIDRLLMPVVLFGHYLALLLWPRHLSPDYGADVIGFAAHANDPYLWLGVAGVLLTLLAIVACWLTRRWFELFSILCYAASYGVVGNIITLIGTNFAERLIYLPSAFLFLAVAPLLAKMPRSILVPAMTSALVLASARTVVAAQDWNNPLILFEKALESQPKSIQLHLLTAQQLHLHGQSTQAQRVLQDACNQYPNYFRVWLYLSLEEMDDGELKTAQQHLNHARQLEANPREILAQERLNKLMAATQPSSRPAPGK